MLQKGEKPGKKAHIEELKYVVCFKESVLAVNKVYTLVSLSTRGICITNVTFEVQYLHTRMIF